MRVNCDDHATTLQASSINCLSEDWHHLSGHRCQCWLQTVEGDLKTQNIGLQPGALHIDVPAGSRWHLVEEPAIVREEQASR